MLGGCDQRGWRREVAVTRRLPRLDARIQIIADGRPTLGFQQWWQKNAESIEAALDANDALDATQEAALEALNTTTERANVAYALVGPGAYSIDATGTLPDDCRTALVDASAGAVTVTLQPVDSCLADVVIKKVDSSGNAVTIEGDGAETIDGAANKSLAAQWNSKTVRPALGEWYLVASV
jgi:hypothetical protein